MRNALAHLPKAQGAMAAAALRQAFLQPDHAAAQATWRRVADGLRPHWPKLGRLMGASEADVLAYMQLPLAHRTKLHSTTTPERLNQEVKRRASVVGIFPSETSIIRLVGAVLPEADDERQPQHRCTGTEALAELPNPDPANKAPQLPPKAA